MKRLRPGCIVVLLLASLAAGVTWAHRGHGHGDRRAHIGVVIGIPLTGSWHYRSHDFPAYPYAYSYPPVIAVPPPVYIERTPAERDSTPPVARQPNYWWYYCPSAQGYYPYVQQCPQGWQPIAPHPPDLR